MSEPGEPGISSEDSGAKAESPTQDHNDPTPLDRKRYRVEKLTLAAVIIYAFIAAVQACQMIQQNRLTEKALKETKTNNIATGKATADALKATQDGLQLTREGQRSWVLLDSIIGGTPSERPCEATVVVRNFGRIPAGISAAVVKRDPRKTPLPKTLDYNDGQSTKSSVYSLGPNQTTSYNLGCRFDGDVVEAIRKGTTVFYIYGSFAYSDLYSAHHTDFCVRFNPDRDNPERGTYGNCPAHNTYD